MSDVKIRSEIHQIVSLIKEIAFVDLLIDFRRNTPVYRCVLGSSAF